MNQENKLKDPYYKSFTRKTLIIIIAVSFAPLITVSGIILNRFSILCMEYLTKPCDFEELVGKGLI